MLDKKLKKVAFETAFKHLTRSNNRSTDRIVRNLMEAGQRFSLKELSEADLELKKHELHQRIQSKEDSEVTLSWLLQLFELSE